MAVALAALDAEIMISGPKGDRSVAVTDFYHSLGNVLEPDEMITQVRIPGPLGNSRQVFLKHRVRDAIDFATVSLGLTVSMDGDTVADSRIVLGAVAPGPYRAAAAEAALADRKINGQALEDVASAAVADAVPLSRNGYKIDIIRSLIKKSYTLI